MLNSEYARQRIIEAAFDLFGRIGYSGTTVRMIAAQADVSLSAIPYYFENKENLFIHIVNRASNDFRTYFSEISEKTEEFLKTSPHDPHQARELLLAFINKHIDYVFDTGNDKQMRLFFQIRSSQDTPVPETDRPGFTTILPISRLLRVNKPSLSEEESVILAYSMIGEQLFFFYHRPSILAQLNRNEYTPETVLIIRGSLIQKLELILEN